MVRLMETAAGCKSTQRYKERKQFTTELLYAFKLFRCKSTQRYKERKQFTTGLIYEAVVRVL